MNPERPKAYEQLSPEAAARVDAVCDGFEKAWKAVRSGAGMPCLTNFLDDCEGPERTILAEELRVLDRACRERYGHTVRPDNSDELDATNLAPTIRTDQFLGRPCARLRLSHPTGNWGLPRRCLSRIIAA
jgi:hypothetical protein